MCNTRRLAIEIARGFLVLCVMFATATKARAQPSDVVTIDEVIASESSDDRHEATRHLFEKATDFDIRRMVINANSEIALAAAWERARRTIDVQMSDWDQVPVFTATEIDGRQVNRFLGVLEGRLQVPVPRWWEQRLLSARAYDLETIKYPAQELGKPYGKVSLEGAANDSLYMLNEQDIMRNYNEPEVLEVELAGQWHRLPPEIAEQIEEDKSGLTLTAAENADHLFVALHRDTGGPYRLFVISKASGDVLRSLDVWGGYMAVRGYSGGGFVHYAWIVPTDKIVYVFGDAGHWMYIEGFNVADGKPVMRFSTSN